MKSSVKRLAKDQINLRQSLPPNYFFEQTDEEASLPDDLTQLRICLTGPEGTPYSQGLWRIRLNIPTDYPQSPPTAVFQTRIFHPNVAEESGAVCLETLKRDWDPKLTLKDILITISCLLIQPNPDSALNQKAGALIQDDYDSFARQARLMTKIHAPIPQQLSKSAQDARRRGEETDEEVQSRTHNDVVQTAVVESKGKPVLRENQPSQNTDVVKDNEQKPRKRSLAESLAGAGDPPENSQGDSQRRKSPRQDLSGSSFTSLEQDNGTKSTSPTTSAKGTTCKPAQHPEKVVFRANWSSVPGTARLKARIGIRRL